MAINKRRGTFIPETRVGIFQKSYLCRSLNNYSRSFIQFFQIKDMILKIRLFLQRSLTKDKKIHSTWTNTQSKINSTTDLTFFSTYLSLLSSVSSLHHRKNTFAGAVPSTHRFARRRKRKIRFGFKGFVTSTTALAGSRVMCSAA